MLDLEAFGLRSEVLMEPFCIDEFVARKGGLITTHLIHVGEFDSGKNSSTLGCHGNGGKPKAAYVPMCTEALNCRLLPPPTDGQRG